MPSVGLNGMKLHGLLRNCGNTELANPKTWGIPGLVIKVARIGEELESET